jgi:hypothetical protein
MKDWWKELKVGDEVCDCRFKHIKVEEIRKDYYDIDYVFLIKYTPDWLPDWLDNWLWTLVPTRSVWSDSTLILEDGNSCSARNCCDPVDHPWEHPTLQP